MMRGLTWRIEKDDFWRSPAGFGVWGVLLGLLAWSWTGRTVLIAVGAVVGVLVAVALVLRRRSRP